MQAFVSVENEAFKLRINTDNINIHNFRPRSRQISLTACQNSFAAFQLLFQCDCRTCINLDDSPWFSEYSESRNIYIRHEGKLQPIMKHIGMRQGDDGFSYADVLESFPVADVPASYPASVFVSFEVPPDCPPGEYSGVFKIVSNYLFEKEVLFDKIKYTLKVLPITLPTHENSNFRLDLWQHNCNIARKAEVSCWSDRHFEIIEKYVKTLADLGVDTVTAVVAEIPWSGQRCFLDKETTSNLFEYSMISIAQQPDKTYTYDYSVLDRYIELCFSYGINREIEVFGLINNWISGNDGFSNYTETADAIRLRYRLPNGTYAFIKKAADIKNYIKALYEHFIEKGWLDKVRVVADEPSDHASFAKTIDMLRKLAPDFRYKAAIVHKEFYDEFSDTVEDFCITLTDFAHHSDEWQEIIKNDKTHNFTFYVCCFPAYPNTFLSNSLLETRYLMIFADYFGFKGFLRWNYTVWPKDPRHDIRLSLWPAGDTNFVYPAGDMTPLLSLRYQALRRAIEDFELLKMLRAAGQNKAVEEIHAKIIKNRDFKSFYEENISQIKFDAISTAKYEDYQKVREIMYSALCK